MPPTEPTGRDYALLAAVLGAFAFVVLTGLAFRSFDRALGAVLLVVGVVAVVYARRLSAARAGLAARVPLWPETAAVRPFTLRLWGAGVAVMGVLMLAGI
jgi:hypothetical protein